MSIEKLKPFLAPTYENFPKGRTIGLVVLRTTQSETIFRTEGTGEPMCSEYVQAGIENTASIPRLVMTKRKQVAPERRKGREFLRSHNLLYTAPKSDAICALNTNAPCEMCIDCFLYGFAAGGEGAQKKPGVDGRCLQRFCLQQNSLAIAPLTPSLKPEPCATKKAMLQPP